MSRDWVWVGIFVILSLFLLPPIMLGFNIFSTLEVHNLSVLQARHANYEQSYQSQSNIFLHIQRHHKRLGKILTRIEYGAKYTQYGVYMTAFITACLSKIPFHFGGSFAPKIIYFPHNYLNIKTTSEVTFGQFFYFISCVLLSFVVVLLRFHWYYNQPQAQQKPKEEEEQQHHQYGDESEVTTEEEPSLLLNKDEDDTDDKPIQEVDWSENEEQPITIAVKKQSFQKFWVHFLIFESGLTTALCIFPMLTLPMIQIDYKGLLEPMVHPSALYNPEDKVYKTSDLVQELHSVTMTFKDVVSAFTHNLGIDDYSKVVVVFLWLQIIILPALSHMLATILFITSRFQMNRGCNKTTSKIVFKSLRACYTGSNLTVFAITVISIAKVIPYISDEGINNNQLCQMIQENTFSGQHEKCLAISVHRRAGTYFFLACGILLDIFSITSLEHFQKQNYYE